MRRALRSASFAWAIVTLVAATGCSSSASQSPGFGTSGAGSDASADAGSGGASNGGPSFNGSADGSAPLMLGDATTASGMGTGTCKDGTYTGTFECTFVFDPDGGAAALAEDAGGIMITGSISFNLSQATGNGESFVDTASGMLKGTAAAFFSISADAGGTLDCNSGVFKGSLTNGDYSGFIFLNGTFSGPLDSQYNGTTFSFVDGTWLLTVPGEGSCPGTWSAGYAGP